MKRCVKCNRLLFSWNTKHGAVSASRTSEGHKEGKICDDCIKKLISTGLSDIDKQILRDMVKNDADK